MDIGKLRAETREMVVPYAGEEIKCQIRPRAVTVRMAERAQRGGIGSDEGLDLLTKVVASWDLTDNGEPVPLTAESLLDLPPDLVEALALGVGEAFRPNPTGSAT